MNAVSSSSRRRIYTDLLLGPIAFHGKEVDILDTAEMARLAELKQLSTVYLFHPHAIHTRWHHSIGVAGIIKFFLDAQPPETKVERDDELLLICAALAHDFGHPAWCHVGEVFAQLRGYKLKHDEISAELVMGNPSYEEYFEEWGLKRISDIVSNDRDRNMIADLIRGDPPIPPRDKKRKLTENEKDEIEKIKRQKTFMGNMIKGPADFDRAEFLMRDSFMSSSLPGLIDVRRIAENLGIVEEKVTKTKLLAYVNLNFAEAMMTARELLYPGVYLENHNLVAEELLIRCLNKAYPQDLDIFKFWFSTDEEVMNKLHEAAKNDQFINKVCRLMRAHRTFNLVSEVTLSDPRLDRLSRENIKYLGSKEGRHKILELEEDVRKNLKQSNLAIGNCDFVIGCWLWGKPGITEAPLVIRNKLSTVSMESRLLEVLETERYVNSRSKLIIGAHQDVADPNRLIEATLKALQSKSYVRE